MLICKPQKAEPDYEQHKVNFHEVANVTMDDLAPDIDNLETSGYQDEANFDDGKAGNQEIDSDIWLSG